MQNIDYKYKKKLFKSYKELIFKDHFTALFRGAPSMFAGFGIIGLGQGTAEYYNQSNTSHYYKYAWPFILFGT